MESLRIARARRTSRRMVSIVATVGLMAGILAITAPTADAVTCLAKDGTQSNSNLQTIINGASTGDTIVIKGVCVGNFAIPGGGIATSLTLTGKGKKVTLNGNNAGPVVFVDTSETVTFKNLLITNGFGAKGGGGIVSDGTVNLTGATKVNGNRAYAGGGILNNGGTLNLGGKVQVDGNTATLGGGIYNFESTVTMNGHAQVNGNTATSDGGGIYNNGGTLVGAVAGGNVKSNNPDDIVTVI